MKSIIQQNKDFFLKYPKIQEALTKIEKPKKGYWYDVSFVDNCLFLFEMTYHKKFNSNIATDRLIMVNEDGIIRDTSKELL